MSASKPATTTPAPRAASAPAPIGSASAKTPAKADPQALRSLTEKLAYELWEQHGRKNGNDTSDWLEAEKIARQRLGL